MTSETSTPAPSPTPSRRRFGAGALLLVAVLSAGLGIGTGLVFHVHDHGNEGGAASPAAAPAAAKETWQCPMHPTVVQDHPGDCPICGMKLVKVAATPPAGGAGGAGETAGQAGVAPAGLAAVAIDPARQQLIGLRTAPVERGAVGGSWRTSGKVAPDESRVHHLNLKVGGFVTHAHAGFVGQPVRRGEPLFSLYSPDLLAAQEEYLLALRTRDQLRAGGGAARDGEDLVAAARRKLELWDMPAAELDRIERTGQPVKDVTFYAPASGVITKRDALPGMRVEAGSMPIELVDLSRVWVLADVYEGELRHVKVGMPATMTLKAYPARAFKGRVSFIAPELDPRTRTVTVRLEFANPGGELKPEMFGEVTLLGTTRSGLRIPADAVINSGTASVVFVALGDGKFQPRKVEVGESDGERIEVAQGLAEGEQVVTRANFLVDSESRLKASLAAMTSAASPDGR